MQRWIKRIGWMSLCAAVGAMAASWWAVDQTQHVPAFYARATERLPQPQTAEASRRLMADVERLQDDAARPGSWHAEFTDDRLNAWLIEELPKKFPRLLARGASEPRVVIEDGRMLAAARYKSSHIDTVISCELEVVLTEQPNMLALRVSDLRAGALRLPLNRFLKGISKEAAKGQVDVRWDLTEEGPVALLNIPGKHPDYVHEPVVVESVQLAEGRLLLAGHTGTLAREEFEPRGPVHRFVSYPYGSKRSRQGNLASESVESSEQLR